MDFLLICCMLFIGNSLSSQDRIFRMTGTIGITTPILDNGFGYHIGLNPNIEISEKLSIEGQLSYLNVNISGSFLSGNTGSSKAFNMLIGPRLYLTPSAKEVRPYLNLLIGGLIHNQELNNRESNPYLAWGLSFGIFLELNRIVLGLSYETPYNIILRGGYRFAF